LDRYQGEATTSQLGWHSAKPPSYAEMRWVGTQTLDIQKKITLPYHRDRRKFVKT